MPSPCIAEIQEQVESALALLEDRGSGFEDSKVQKVRKEIWPKIISAINSCPNFTGQERGWLKYSIFERLDAIRLQGGKPTPIDVEGIVNKLPSGPGAGEPPRVITSSVFPRIIPF